VNDKKLTADPVRNNLAMAGERKALRGSYGDHRLSRICGMPNRSNLFGLHGTLHAHGRIDKRVDGCCLFPVQGLDAMVYRSGPGTSAK